MSYWLEDADGEYLGDLATNVGINQLRKAGSPALRMFLNQGFANENLIIEIVYETSADPKLAYISAMFDGAKAPVYVTDGCGHADDLSLDDKLQQLADNVFCPTGSGGGVDPSCSPEGSKSAVKATLARVHADLFLRARHGDNEKLYVINRKTGAVIVEREGDKEGVHGESSDLINPDGIILTHSHPNPGGFSGNDWETFTSNRDVREIIAVTSEADYHLTKTESADKILVEIVGAKPWEVHAEEKEKMLSARENFQLLHDFSGSMKERVDNYAMWMLREVNRRVVDRFPGAFVYEEHKHG